MSIEAIQNLIPDNHCIGCGPDNEQGLKIKSTWCGDLETECFFQPRPHMASAPASVLNGGVIATVLDCHSVCTAVSYGRKLDGVADSEPGALYATGSLEIRYLKPAAIDLPLHVKARIVGVAGLKTVIECSASSGGDVCAEATVVAIRVPPGWGLDGCEAAPQKIPAPDQALGGWAPGPPPIELAKTA